MQIDEAGRDDQPARVQHANTIERRFGDRGYPSTADTDIAHRIETALRIDDPPAANDEIVRLLGLRRGAGGEHEREERSARGPRQ